MDKGERKRRGKLVFLHSAEPVAGLGSLLNCNSGVFFVIRWGLLSYSPAHSNPEEDQELLNPSAPSDIWSTTSRPSLMHFSHLFLKALISGVSRAPSVPLLGATVDLENVLQFLTWISPVPFVTPSVEKTNYKPFRNNHFQAGMSPLLCFLSFKAAHFFWLSLLDHVF